MIQSTRLQDNKYKNWTRRNMCTA